MAKIIGVMNEKGGVGKTTVCYNLAKGLAALGYKVLAVDNDPQTNLTTSMLESKDDLELTTLDIYDEAFEKSPNSIDQNLDFIGATERLSIVTDRQAMDVWPQLKGYFAEVKDQYDFVFIDCGPLFGGLNVASLIAADSVITPIKPAPYSIDGLKKLASNIDKINRKEFNTDLKIGGIIFNLVEHNTLHREMMSLIKEEYGDLVFFHSINRGTKLEESPFFNQSIFEYAEGTKQSIQFNAVIKEFLKRYK